MENSKIYGIRIDMNNLDPESAVTYTDDAIGFYALSCDGSTGVCNYGSWKDIITNVFGCRPCLYKDGVNVGYLNPDNYAQYENNTVADITSGSAGEVMVEFKKTWYKYAVSGNILTFQVATYDRSADGFVCSAFKSMDGNATEKDYMYYGAYEGYSMAGDNKCHSLSGKNMLNNDWSYTVYRTNCKALGSSYGMEDWVKRYYILGLLMLITKTRGIQAAIGDGRCETDSTINSGTMDTKGLFYGLNDGGHVGVKAFGIENLWGNLWNWCDGIIVLSSSTLRLKECPPYNDIGSGYASIADGVTRGSWLYPTAYKAALNGAVIVASSAQSDASLGWCDGVGIDPYALRVTLVSGGFFSGLADAGPFYVNITNAAFDDYTYCVGRLVAS